MSTTSKRTLCCSKAAFAPSRSVFDPRKQLFGKQRTKEIDSTLDFNLNDWCYGCPLGYDQHGNRCTLVEKPYPTFYKGVDIWKSKVLKEMQKDKEM